MGPCADAQPKSGRNIKTVQSSNTVGVCQNIQHPDDSLRELIETAETLFVNEHPLQRNQYGDS
jgi:hypothetical protein